MELVLRLYPDPVLLKTAAPVEVFDAELADKVARMWDIMYASKGVGLAAPQVGWSAQLLIHNHGGSRDDESESQVIINPSVTKRWGKKCDSEGCLSFPEIFVDVTRPAGIHLQWQDLSGERHEADFNDFPARVVQHEMDHLTGVLLVHRMSPVDKIRYRFDLEQLAAEAAER
jgi:peptide deformylase